MHLFAVCFVTEFVLWSPCKGIKWGLSYIIYEYLIGLLLSCCDGKAKSISVMQGAHQRMHIALFVISFLIFFFFLLQTYILHFLHFTCRSIRCNSFYQMNIAQTHEPSVDGLLVIRLHVNLFTSGPAAHQRIYIVLFTKHRLTLIRLVDDNFVWQWWFLSSHTINSGCVNCHIKLLSTL